MTLRIAILVKPVPDPVVGGERLGPDHRLDRTAAPPVINGNDEYALADGRDDRRGQPRPG